MKRYRLLTLNKIPATQYFSPPATPPEWDGLITFSSNGRSFSSIMILANWEEGEERLARNDEKKKDKLIVIWITVSAVWTKSLAK